MDNLITINGIVLRAAPQGEWDKRLVLLTRERGKITVFAKGARRPNSVLVGAATSFAFGSFELFEGRTSYTLRNASITEHFEHLSLDPEAMCYASYFSELADHYSRENVDGGPLLLLLYVALRALRREELDRELIQSVLELRLMAQEGEYFDKPRTQAGAAALYAWEYVLTAPLQKLFSFGLEPDAKREFRNGVEDMKERLLDRSFRSLDILREMRSILETAGPS